MALTPQELEQYYKTQGSAARPLSPIEYETQLRGGSVGATPAPASSAAPLPTLPATTAPTMPSTGPTLPTTTSSVPSPTLPTTATPGSNLMAFNNTLNNVLNLAAKKRQTLETQFLGSKVPIDQGLVSASSFGDIVSFLNKRREADVSPLVSGVTKAFEADQKQAPDDKNTIRDLALQAAQNGSSQEIVNSILATNDLDTAIKIAAPSFQKKNFELREDSNGNLTQYELDKDGQVIDSKIISTKVEKPGTGSGINNQVIDNERAFFGQFKAEPIVKDYNVILNKKLSVDSIIANGTGGPADLAVVYEFMKSLDSNSVVRETEYATAAKSGNIFAGVFARFNGYLKPEGGFLPQAVRNEFQSLINQKLEVSKVQYDNVVKEYRGIAERQGLNPDNVALNYAGAAPSEFGSDPSDETLNKLDEEEKKNAQKLSKRLGSSIPGSVFNPGAYF